MHAYSSALSLSCASLKVEARVQVGLRLPDHNLGSGFSLSEPREIEQKLGYKQCVMVGAKISSPMIEELEG